MPEPNEPDTRAMVIDTAKLVGTILGILVGVSMLVWVLLHLPWLM